MNNERCEAIGCRRKVFKQELCRKHYGQLIDSHKKETQPLRYDGGLVEILYHQVTRDEARELPIVAEVIPLLHYPAVRRAYSSVIENFIKSIMI